MLCLVLVSISISMLFFLDLGAGQVEAGLVGVTESRKARQPEKELMEEPVYQKLASVLEILRKV